MAPAKRADLAGNMRRGLARYDGLLSSLATLMYLPAFFVDQHARVKKTVFTTELHARRSTSEVQKAIRAIGRSHVPFTREVWCLESQNPDRREDTKTIAPPDLEFAETGFWKSLPPGDVGTDESGNPIVGKTWVERTETWSTQRLESFVVQRRLSAARGPKAGTVYVMRSGSHGIDLARSVSRGVSPMNAPRN